MLYLKTYYNSQKSFFPKNVPQPSSPFPYFHLKNPRLDHSTFLLLRLPLSSACGFAIFIQLISTLPPFSFSRTTIHSRRITVEEQSKNIFNSSTFFFVCHFHVTFPSTILMARFYIVHFN